MNITLNITRAELHLLLGGLNTILMHRVLEPDEYALLIKLRQLRDQETTK